MKYHTHETISITTPKYQGIQFQYNGRGFNMSIRQQYNISKALACWQFTNHLVVIS